MLQPGASLKDKVDTDEWNADLDLKEFVVNKSVELLAHAHVVTQFMPGSVAAVDTTTITDFKLSLSQLCALVKKLKAGYPVNEAFCWFACIYWIVD